MVVPVFISNEIYCCQHLPLVTFIDLSEPVDTTSGQSNFSDEGKLRLLMIVTFLIRWLVINGSYK